MILIYISQPSDKNIFSCDNLIFFSVSVCDLTAVLKCQALPFIELHELLIVVRASDSGSGDPGPILGRVGVLFP